MKLLKPLIPALIILGAVFYHKEEIKDMKKISTLFKKDPNNLGRVINEVNPENEWVYGGFALPTRKFDGTSCAIINGELYKRYDCKINKETGEYKKPIPTGAIPCQDADRLSGHHPHWIKCERSDKSNKYHFEAFDSLMKNIITDNFDPNRYDGTYELCGPKVQGNPERLDCHKLIRHGGEKCMVDDFGFDELKAYLNTRDIEGIVFHHITDGRMCKIRKSDFGIRR